MIDQDAKDEEDFQNDWREAAENYAEMFECDLEDAYAAVEDEVWEEHCDRIEAREKKKSPKQD